MKKLITLSLGFFFFLNLSAQNTLEDGLIRIKQYNVTWSIATQGDTLWQATTDALFAINSETKKVLGKFEAKNFGLEDRQPLKITELNYDQTSGKLWFLFNDSKIGVLINNQFSIQEIGTGFKKIIIGKNGKIILTTDDSIVEYDGKKLRLIIKFNDDELLQSTKFNHKDELVITSNKRVLVIDSNNIDISQPILSNWAIADEFYQDAEFYNDTLVILYLNTSTQKAALRISSHNFSTQMLLPIYYNTTKAYLKRHNNLFYIPLIESEVIIVYDKSFVKIIQTMTSIPDFGDIVIDSKDQIWFEPLPEKIKTYFHSNKKGLKYLDRKGEKKQLLNTQPLEEKYTTGWLNHAGKLWYIINDSVFCKEISTGRTSSKKIPEKIINSQLMKGFGKDVILVSVSKKFYKFDGLSIKEIFLPALFINNKPRDIHNGKALFYNTSNFNFTIVDSTGKTTVLKNKGDLFPADMKLDNDGAVWVANVNGLVVHKNNRIYHWVSIFFEPRLSKIFRGQNNDIIAVAGDKLYVYSYFKLNKVVEMKGDLFTDSKNRIWSLSQNDCRKISILEDNLVRDVLNNDKFDMCESEYMNQLIEDEEGRVYFGNYYYNENKGKIVIKNVMNLDGNCSVSAKDLLFKNTILYLTDNKNNEFRIPIDEYGIATAYLPSGIYANYAFQEKSVYWENCENNQPITIHKDEVSYANLLIKPNIEKKPKLKIELTAPRLVRCFENKVFLKVCNEGTSLAENPIIDIELPEGLTLKSISNPYKKIDRIIRIKLDNIPINTCNTLYFNVLVDCTPQNIGASLCIKAVAKLDSLSLLNSNTSINPHIVAEAICEGEKIKLLLKNIGKMTSSPIDYTLFKDDKAQEVGTVKLQGGEVKTFTKKQDNSIWRLSAKQDPNFEIPDSHPSVNSNYCKNKDEATTRASDSQNSYITGLLSEVIECTTVTGSYDPNDKSAMPIGYENQHFIEPDTKLNYLIRFQNIGTDTAFTVVIKDKIDENLDLKSLREGISSHPYTIEIKENREVYFIFKNIMLPDSNIDKLNSNGFVRFSIRPIKNIRLGTVVKNYCDIFFDFNDAVTTNTVSHTFDKNFIKIEKSTLDTEYNINFNTAPNPSEDIINLLFESDPEENTTLHLFNNLGQIVRIAPVNNITIPIERNNLPSGLYILVIYREGRKIGEKKIIFN